MATASSWPITSKARSVTIYSMPPAAWASKASSQGTAAAYRGGRCKHWLKVKNRTHPAYSRAGKLRRAVLGGKMPNV
jgi:hypothetical protein